MIVVPSSADAASLPIDLSGEVRLRYDHYESAGLRCDVDYGQTLVRGIIGADLHLSPNIRLRADVGTGQAWGKHGNAPPSIQNTASLQQAFVEVSQRKRIGELLRITASWQARKDFLIATDIEHFFVGRVLQGAGLSSGDYASLSATFRFGSWRS